MDNTFNWKSWTRDPAERAAGEAGAPEWHELRARLAATRAARRALAGLRAAGEIAFEGSFDGVSARALADYDQCLPAVNPVFWANRKWASAMDAGVADPTSPGDRG
jgi:hypothetical protein